VRRREFVKTGLLATAALCFPDATLINMALFRTRHSRLSELMPLFVDCARGCKPVG